MIFADNGKKRQTMAKGRKKTSDALQEAPGYDQPCRMDGADIPAVIALASEFPKEFEKLVLTGKIEHLGNPLLRWMLASTVVKTDPAGNIEPDKEKSAEKIDGIVASIMALGEWMTAQGEEDNNHYNNRGMMSLKD